MGVMTPKQAVICVMDRRRLQLVCVDYGIDTVDRRSPAQMATALAGRREMRLQLLVGFLRERCPSG
jgi:hypothetical protein